MGPTASMGIYINSGSIYETASSTGASAMLECLAFKATRHRDTLRVMKEVEQMGANIAANGSREQMSYTIDCLRSHAPAALELLADCVLNPAFLPHEIEEQKMRMQMLLSLPDVQLTLLSEKLLRSAYEGALSQPLIPELVDLQHINPHVLADFVNQHYTGKRLVLAGAGLHHQQLVDLAAPMLEQLPPGQEAAALEPASRYRGAHVQLEGSAPHANLILAFEYPGGWRDIQGSVVMTVLTYLLGGGNSFSSGGPGKGMHSRLYTRVLNYHHWVHSCASYSNTLNDTGLMGIQAACDPGQAQKMLDVMCGELESLTRPPPTEQLERAKAMATSLIQNALEGKAARAEDIGRQFLTYGYRVNVREYEEMIRSVSGVDIANFTRRLLSSKPSLATYGDGSEAASYEGLLQRYSQVNLHNRAAAAGGEQQQLVHGVLERLKQGFGSRGFSSSSSSSSSSEGNSSSSEGSSRHCSSSSSSSSEA
uniref:Alpha-MPP n=1 Tax=Tetradesmus obliquus TaxID=3088 RepID=A0A383V7X6_TETOB|eukprot:jgi/Sobl393_1/6869/SZX61685.1